ncbi:ParA family protein [Polycladospora coralii]
MYSVLMNKGGCGKTSLITNLASALSSENENVKVLIIDMDPQGNAALTFGLTPNDIEYTMYQVLTGEDDISEITIQVENNLYIAPSNSEMDFLEFEVLPNIEKYKNPFLLLKEKLDAIKNDYDYIFIDTPPSLGLIAGNVLAVTDEIIIPFVPDSFGVHGFIRVVQALQDFKEDQGIDVNVIGVVSMLVDNRTKLHQDMIADAKEYCKNNNIRMFKTAIPRSIRFAASVGYDRKPAVLSSERSNPIVKSYIELMKELLENE